MTPHTTTTEGLPESDSPHEVLGTMHYVLQQLGKELGRRYDAELSKTNAYWIKDLEDLRHQRIHLYDAHFVLAEPLKHPDSPTRACLPTGGAFYNLMEDTLQVRNKWSHHEIPTLNLTALRGSVAIIHQFATAAEMRLGALCSHINKRIRAINNGTYPPAGTTLSTDANLDALLAELQQARQAEEKLKADAAAAQELLDQAAANGAQNDRLHAQLQEAEAALQAALADLARKEFVIEGLASEPAPEPEPEPAPLLDATPGHPWPHDLPSRQVTLMTLHNDLFDGTTSTRVADEFGDVAPGVIASWKKTVPANTTIYLTPLGQAVTYINGTAIYLGSLSEQPPSETPAGGVEGFFTPHRYTLRLNGSIEDRATGDTLSSVNRSAAPRIAKQLLAAAPTGGRLRVTTTGQVARFSDGRWTPIADIQADDWFPGHLS